MSETTDKAQEKLLASMTKSQEAAEGETSKKPTVSRKRSNSSTKQGEYLQENSMANSRGYEMRNRFNGRLRWPD